MFLSYPFATIRQLPSLLAVVLICQRDVYYAQLHLIRRVPDLDALRVQLQIHRALRLLVLLRTVVAKLAYQRRLAGLRTTYYRDLGSNYGHWEWTNFKFSERRSLRAIERDNSTPK